MTHEKMIDDAQGRLNSVAHLLPEDVRIEVQGELIRMWSKGRRPDDACLAFGSLPQADVMRLINYIFTGVTDGSEPPIVARFEL